MLCAPQPKTTIGSRLFQASAAPRPENSDTNEKDALFGLGRQKFYVTILQS
jgi:hypothetical protein